MMTLSNYQTIALATMLRGQIIDSGVYVMSRATNPDAFDAMIKAMTDEQVILDALGEDDAATADTTQMAGPTVTPEPVKPTRDLVPEWEAEGAAAFEAGHARESLTGGPRRIKGLLAGWDRAKAAYVREGLQGECAAPERPNIGGVVRTPAVDLGDGE